MLQQVHILLVETIPDKTIVARARTSQNKTFTNWVYMFGIDYYNKIYNPQINLDKLHFLSYLFFKDIKVAKLFLKVKIKKCIYL